jgi:hypothetical protein
MLKLGIIMQNYNKKSHYLLQLIHQNHIIANYQDY